MNVCVVTFLQYEGSLRQLVIYDPKDLPEQPALGVAVLEGGQVVLQREQQPLVTEHRHAGEPAVPLLSLPYVTYSNVCADVYMNIRM
jgi:hypothetical protein